MTDFLNRLLKLFENAAEPVLGYAGAIFAALMMMAGMRAVFEISAAWGQWPSFAISCLAIVLCVALVIGVRNRVMKSTSGREIVGLFMTAALCSMAAFASLSFLVHNAGLGGYIGAQVSIGKLTDLYAYIMIDAIPGVHVWETFKIQPPLDYQGFVPSFLIFTFRLLIVIQLASALKEWFIRFERVSEVK